MYLFFSIPADETRIEPKTTRFTCSRRANGRNDLCDDFSKYLNVDSLTKALLSSGYSKSYLYRIIIK